jgi:putative transposase
MSRRGDCHDNAVMESFFSTVKSELADRFDSFAEAKMALFDYIDVFYNRVVIQRSARSARPPSSDASMRRSHDEGTLSGSYDSCHLLDGHATERLSTFLEG